MPFGERSNPVIPKYGRARKPRPDLRGSKRQRHRRHQRRRPTVSRHSGGTSGDLSVPGFKSKTPVISRRRALLEQRLSNLQHSSSPILGNISAPETPESALSLALTAGVEPSDEFRRLYGKDLADAIDRERITSYVGSREGIQPDLAGELAIGLVGGLGAGAAGRLAATLGKGAAGAISGAAAGTEAEAGGGALRALLSGRAARGAVRKAAARAEPTAMRGARQGIAQRAGEAASKLPASVRTGGRVAGRAASLPIRHPIKSPIAAQVPVAAANREPGSLIDALEGKGVYANVANDLAEKLGGVPGEAVALPAAILPSVYLTGKAGYEAAKGDPGEAERLLDQWKEIGLLPALAEGRLGDAAENLKEHPLFSGLEASGAVSAAGRLAGAGARALPGRVGEMDRAPLPVRGTSVAVERGYSPDLFRQGLQRLYDRTRAGQEIRPDTFRGRKRLKEAANRFESGAEAVRRRHVRDDLQALKDILPKKRFGRVDRPSGDVVNLGVERILRNPSSFAEDLPLYKEMIEAAARERGPDGRPVMDKAQLAANRELVQQIETGLAKGDPENIVQAANAFVELQRPILEGLVEQGLLTKTQAARASATSFARVHMGAKHDPEVGIVDAQGKPLPTTEILGEMERQGVEPAGFLSHRPPANSDFYKSFFGGAQLEKGTRTGESVASGAQLGGIESLVRQLRRSRGLLDRANAWNAAVTRFGVEIKGVKTWSDAKKVLRDPERYGLDPDIQPVAVPRHPFTAKKREIEGALEHQDPTVAGDFASGALKESLDDAFNGQLADDAPVVFMPGKVAEELRAGATPSGPVLRGAQAATTAFKRAVLPFSPGFYIGNGFDNALRTALAGINPAHFYIGSKVRKNLSPEEEAELLAGAHFSSVEKLAPHRSVESLARGYDPLSKTVRSAAEWARRRGWKQATVKFAPKAITELARWMLAVNAYLTEILPQRGALGKIALAEMRKTQGSWVKALKQMNKIGEEFAKDGRLKDDTLIRFQKQIEQTYGNYTRMSPGARKVLTNVSPFFTWLRAAYTFVYLTMPAHHPVQTGALTAAAQATQPDREDVGLDPEGERPLPPFLQGGIPLENGGLFPTAHYTSSGYAADPIDAINKSVFPQIRGAFEALSGRDWKGEELPGGEQGKLIGALWSLGTSFIPGANLIGDEEEGHKVFAPHVNLPHPYDKGYLEYKREPTQQITVPEGGDSGSSSEVSPFLKGYAEDLGAGSAGTSDFLKGYAQDLIGASR